MKALCDTEMLLFHCYHGRKQNANIYQIFQLQSIIPHCFNNKVHCVIWLRAPCSLQASPEVKWKWGEKPEVQREVVHS